MINFKKGGTRFMQKLKKPAMLCAALLMMASLLCGCMKMHIDIVWNDDNSANIALTVGVSKSALELMDISEAELREQLREEMAGEGDYSFENFSDSEYTGIKAKLKIDDITENSADSLDTLNFSCVEGDSKKTYTVSGSFDNSDIMEGDEFAGIEVDMKISLVMPGKIVSHNATERDGNKLTWVLTESSTVSIQATSEATESGGGSPWLWIAIGAIVLVVVVVVALMLSRKRG